MVLTATSQQGLNLHTNMKALHVIHLGPVVQMLNKAIHRINRYPVDYVIRKFAVAQSFLH